jgi:hypothetical protein
MSDKPPDWSLKKEMQKRKTQEIIRGVEQKRISQAMDPVPSPSPKDGKDPKTAPGDLKRTTGTLSAAKTASGEVKRATSTIPAAKSTTGEFKRTTGTVPAARTSIGDPKRATQLSQAASASRRTTASMVPIPSATDMVGSARRRILPILVGVLIMLIVAMGLAIGAGGLKIKTPTPTYIILPVVTAQDVIAHLKGVGVPISNLVNYPAPNQTWRATQEYQFDVQKDGYKGTFVILSYPSPAQAASDAFHLKTDAKYKGWRHGLYNNLFVLSPPESAVPINNEIASHLSSYLYAPYFKVVSTATPTPVPPTTQATASASQ